MDKLKVLETLHSTYENCQQCPKLCKSRTRTVFGYGSQDAKILIVGQAPGETEDNVGLPLIGPSGRILDYFLARAYSSRDDRFRKLVKDFKIQKGFSNRYNYTWGSLDKETNIYSSHWAVKQLLANDVFYTNLILCATEKDREPDKAEIDMCSARLKETIYTVDPIVIIAVGGLVLSSLFNKRGMNITKYKGQILDLSIPGKQTNIKYPVIPILPPAHLMRNPSMEEGTDWDLTEKAVQKAVSLQEEYLNVYA